MLKARRSLLAETRGSIDQSIADNRPEVARRGHLSVWTIRGALRCGYRVGVWLVLFLDFGPALGQSVTLDRPRPEYDPLGIHVRSFFIMPSVTSRLLFDDNVFASGSSKKSDWTLRTSPRLRIQSDWPNHDLTLQVAAENVAHRRFSGNDHMNISSSLAGGLDVRHNVRVTANLEYRDATLERGIDDTAVALRLQQPVELQQINVDSRISMTFARLEASLGLSATNTDYEDTAGSEGNFNDGTVTEVSSELAYALTPVTQLFARSSYNARRFASSAADSDGFQTVIGLAFESSPLITGQAYAGYQAQNFQSPSLDDVTGWTFGGRLTWAPTPLISVSLDADRNVGQSSFNGGSSVLTTDGLLRVDYEFRRNIILSSFFGYTVYEFNDVRTDTRQRAGAEAHYLINRWLSMGLTATHARFHSDYSESFERDQVGVFGRVQY